ncbi:FGGY-family carbohydrate kinase [soil metagenome]
MGDSAPRGIAVIDVGASNIKAVLFDPALNPVAERKTASGHASAPPYAMLDPVPLAAFLRKTLPELDGILPLDVIVPCTHGSAVVCIAADGTPALPLMDYMAEPPPEIVAAYRTIEPPFDEVFCKLLPAALTVGLQLYWQQTAFPAEFARVKYIQPLVQHLTLMLTGVPLSEITGLSTHTQLMDVRNNIPSSLARRQGWDRMIAPRQNAWDLAGPLLAQFRGTSFQGRGAVLTGIHDSNANYLRYLAAGMGNFTLLSTGTWIIGFDTSATLDTLKPERDMLTFTDLLGRPVACFRFFGGREYEILGRGAPAEAATHEAALRLMAQGTFALPSFTDSGGPMPGTGNKGRIVGPIPETPEEWSSLAAIYCALMSDQSLTAISSKGAMIVDGPFAQNPVYLDILAALRPWQRLYASQLRDGTTAGVAIVALMRETGKIPSCALDLDQVPATPITGLDTYAAEWLRQSST